jgi:hypothetical protein
MNQRLLGLSAGLLLFVTGCCTSASNEPFTCDQAFVKPIIIFDGASPDGKYVYVHVKNWCNYPNDLFTNSADYPCGQNPVASRGHVSTHDGAGQYAGWAFCGLTSSTGLKSGVWYPVPAGVTSGTVKLKIKDTKCDRVVESDPVSWSLEKSAPYALDPFPQAVQVN